ncbi:MAG: hypothetical protein QOF15_909 [Mycobacterium sp.]|jgi:hypothetical protein|nr:hypothetical protein [Mycobacterium sp.]
MVALVEVFIRVSAASSTTFTRSQYPTSLNGLTRPFGGSSANARRGELRIAQIPLNTGEPELDLALGRFGRIRAVHQVELRL